MQAHSGQRNQALVDQGSGHLIFHGFLLFPDPLLHSLSLSAGITPHTAAAKSCQSCPTLLNPIDGSPTDSSVSGILQARTLEWVAISFSNAWKWKNKVKSLSHVWLFATPWNAAHQAPPSMGFSRQEHWSGVPSPSPTFHTTHTQFTCHCLK